MLVDTLAADYHATYGRELRAHTHGYANLGDLVAKVPGVLSIHRHGLVYVALDSPDFDFGDGGDAGEAASVSSSFRRVWCLLFLALRVLHVVVTSEKSGFERRLEGNLSAFMCFSALSGRQDSACVAWYGMV